MGKFSKMHCAKNPFKKMDAMYNGEPGIQKEDFKQFSDSPMSFDTLRQAKKYSIKKAKDNWKKGNTEEFQDLNKDGVVDKKDYRQTIRNIRKGK